MKDLSILRGTEVGAGQIIALEHFEKQANKCLRNVFHRYKLARNVRIKIVLPEAGEITVSVFHDEPDKEKSANRAFASYKRYLRKINLGIERR